MSDVGVTEYRIDELAQLADTTVRNIRAYQDRGLLPPPRRSGRVGLYSAAHLARLRLIGQMLARGYSLGNIAELLVAWERGQDLSDLLGLEAALTEPWSEQVRRVISPDELAELLDDPLEPGGILDLLLADGFVRREGDGFVVDSPRLVPVGAELMDAGVPLSALLTGRRDLRERIDAVAGAFVDVIVEHIFEPFGDRVPAAEVPRLAELVRRLRPLAKEAVSVELADAMERQVQARMSAWLSWLAEHSATDGHAPGQERTGGAAT